MSNPSAPQQESQAPMRPDATARSRLFGFFFLRTTFGMLLTVLLVVAGALAYFSMVKESSPDLAIPQALITVEWPGTDPQTIELEVTNKMEKELKSLKGLKKISSASFDSFCMIAVEFTAAADLIDAMQRLRAKVNAAEAELPKEIEKPKVKQVSVDDTPILTVAIYGDLDDALLGRAADALKNRLEKVSGVNEVKLSGRREEVIRIRLIPPRMEGLGLSPTAVRDAIRQANLDMPWDKLESEAIGSTFRLFGRFRDLAAIQKLPVARLAQGRVVRLEEIAEIRRDLERVTNRAALSSGGSPFKPCIDISITKSPGADTLAIIEKLKAVFEEARAGPDWPYGMQSRIISDQSIEIWNNLDDVFSNGWQAMLFVFLVLFVMLSWREATVAGLAIPLTFLGALGVIWLLGHTLNQMIIVGMVLALGLLVDVFILMMEGMHDGMFVMGLSFPKAAARTVKTYAAPAFVGQLTTVLAMAPLMAISGVDGKFIRLIPITVIVCLIVSFIVAFLVCVPLSRLLLASLSGAEHKTAIDRLTERVSGSLREWSLTATLRNRLTAFACVVVAVVVFFISLMGFGLLPVEMYARADGRNLGITVELPPSTTLDRSQSCADALGALLSKKEYFESVVSFTGKKSPMAVANLTESLLPESDAYIVGFSCKFIPRDQREGLAYTYLPALRRDLEKALREFPGGRMTFFPETGGTGGGDPVQVDLFGDDIGQLREISASVQAHLRKISGATDIRDTLGPVRADFKVIPKREALDFFGITLDELATQVRFAMADDQIGKFPLGGTEEDLEIRLGTAWPSRSGSAGGPTNISELASIRVFPAKGRSQLLFSMVDAEMTAAPLAITRKGGERCVTVMCKTQDRTAGEIFAELEGVLAEEEDRWPAGYTYRFAGEAESSAEAFGSALKMLLVAVFLVFAVLAIQFDSFRQPFVIMLSVPLALLGTCGGFFLAGIPFSFNAMIGVIALVGIAVNDAIVMIETMNLHRDGGMRVREAAARGAADRLRPILSTTITTLVGLTPLAMSDPSWMPLCMAIIFGLLAATVISLLVIPCLYMLLTPEERQTATA